MKRDRVPWSTHDSRITTHAVALAAAALLAACGLETATTAATGAAIKKQELDQGKKTLEQTQQKVEQAAQQIQQRAEQGRDAADK